MSRTGNKPIEIPSDVTVSLDGNKATVKGPKGELTQSFDEEMTIKVEDNQVTVTRPSDSKKHRSIHGTTRSLLSNMIEGVSKGCEKSLE